MEPALLVSAAVASTIVVLTPGPAVIAFLGIGAGQGRGAGAWFLLGHLAGDLLWAGLALIAIVGTSMVAPWLFDLVALFCGVYLFWLGTRALLARPRRHGEMAMTVRRPLARGIVFGLSNPKSYPVTLSVFTAVLAGKLDRLSPGSAPLLLAACFAGFLVADAILVWLVGIRPVRRFYRANEIWILRLTGLLFVGFAASTLYHAWQGWSAAPAR
jgi:threonine/homoserine/homoserine lactone efflux protein